VKQFLPESKQNLSTDMAVTQIKSFLRQTGQPIDQKLLQNVFNEKTNKKTNADKGMNTNDEPHDSIMNGGGDEGLTKMDMSK